MTIPKGTEQWECDLIAPSAAPGLTDAVSMPMPEVRAMYDQWYQIHGAGPLWLIEHGYAAGFAAGRAHPQGPPREPTEVMLQAARKAWHEYHNSLAAQRSAPTAEAFMWRAMWDAAPAASQVASHDSAVRKYEWTCRKCGQNCTRRESVPAPAAVAEPGDCAACLQPEVWSVHSCGPPSAPQAQEDALVQRLNMPAKCTGDTGLHADAADRIKADAAELKRQNEANDMLAKERDAFQARAATLQAQHEADAAELGRVMRELNRAVDEGADAEAARDEAYAVLQQIADEQIRGVSAATHARAFLAQADARSDKGAG